MARKRPPKPGLQEGATPFESVRPTDQQLADAYARVLAAYDFTCVATRRRFASGESNARLAVVPIRPTEVGGSYKESNLLPFCLDVAEAFKDGDFTIGVDLELVVNLRRIEADILLRLNSDGEILLPNDRECWPDLENLRYHREFIFLAVGG